MQVDEQIQEVATEEVQLPDNSKTLQLITAHKTAINLEELKKNNPPIVIAGVEDKKMLTIVNVSRLAVRKERLDYTKYADGIIDKMKESVSNAQNLRDGVIGDLKAIEKQYQDEEDRIDDIKQTIIAQSRVDQFAKYDTVITIEEAKKFKTVKEFSAKLAKAMKKWEDKQKEIIEPVIDDLIITTPDPSGPIAIPAPEEVKSPFSESPATEVFRASLQESVDFTITEQGKIEEETTQISDKELIIELRSTLTSLSYPECEGDKAERLVYGVKGLVKKVIEYIDQKSVDL